MRPAAAGDSCKFAPAAADSWVGATEDQERALYCAAFRLFQKGLSEALCGVLREKSHPHLLPYIGGCFALNYYLKHNFKAPAPVPTWDFDVKVEFGEHMRTMLAERGILYAPDYVINAGGIISVTMEYLCRRENAPCDINEVRKRIALIPDRLTNIWQDSEATGISPDRVADAMAQKLIGRG